MSDRYIGSIDATMAMAHKRQTVAAVVEKTSKSITAMAKKEDAWALCGMACQCNLTPCAIAGWQKCSECGE